MCPKLVVCAGMAARQTPPSGFAAAKRAPGDAQTPPIGRASECAIRQKIKTVCHTKTRETRTRFFITRVTVRAIQTNRVSVSRGVAVSQRNCTERKSAFCRASPAPRRNFGRRPRPCSARTATCAARHRPHLCRARRGQKWGSRCAREPRRVRPRTPFADAGHPRASGEDNSPALAFVKPPPATDLASRSSPPQVAVIYYSRNGRLVTLANIIAEGIRQVRRAPPRPTPFPRVAIPRSISDTFAPVLKFRWKAQT